jgi:hypothetical protein
MSLFVSRMCGKTNLYRQNIILDAIFSGHVTIHKREYDHQATELWHELSTTPSGEAWLETLSSISDCVVSSDELQQRVRIYNHNYDGERYIQHAEEKLAYKMDEIEASEETHIIPFDKKSIRALLKSGTFVKIQKRIEKAKVSLNVIKRTLVFQCSGDLVQESAYGVMDGGMAISGSCQHNGCEFT